MNILMVGDVVLSIDCMRELFSCDIASCKGICCVKGDAGAPITPEEAEMHPQRNVLLQCIGASDFIVPDFYEGQVKQGDRFLLCSDGFRHVISSQEIYDKLNKASAPDPQAMKQALVYLTDLDKSRLETDNITAIIVEAEN